MSHGKNKHTESVSPGFVSAEQMAFATTAVFPKVIAVGCISFTEDKAAATICSCLKVSLQGKGMTDFMVQGAVVN